MTYAQQEAQAASAACSPPRASFRAKRRVAPRSGLSCELLQKPRNRPSRRGRGGGDRDRPPGPPERTAGGVTRVPGQKCYPGARLHNAGGEGSNADGARSPRPSDAGSGAPRSLEGPATGYARGVDYSSIITIDPARRSGKPTIRGMRITVQDVLEYLAGGMTVDEILVDFPELTEADIRACLAFAADRERRLFTRPA
jgi:uncharacterized protein (DUF433 family)